LTSALNSTCAGMRYGKRLPRQCAASTSIVVMCDREAHNYGIKMRVLPEASWRCAHRCRVAGPWRSRLSRKAQKPDWI